mmetsp:Transcript_63084/g.150357  ORF Transcript_63084/g.150357 Transcript_63084/m.150357 type:complete len:215 (-) Transcript_63084:81-725(-)
MPPLDDKAIRAEIEDINALFANLLGFPCDLKSHARHGLEDHQSSPTIPETLSLPSLGSRAVASGGSASFASTGDCSECRILAAELAEVKQQVAEMQIRCHSLQWSYARAQADAARWRSECEALEKQVRASRDAQVHAEPGMHPLDSAVELQEEQIASPAEAKSRPVHPWLIGSADTASRRDFETLVIDLCRRLEEEAEEAARVANDAVVQPRGS